MTNSAMCLNLASKMMAQSKTNLGTIKNCNKDSFVSFGCFAAFEALLMATHDLACVWRCVGGPKR